MKALFFAKVKLTCAVTAWTLMLSVGAPLAMDMAAGAEDGSRNSDPANAGGGKEQVIFSFERDEVAKWSRKVKEEDPAVFPNTLVIPSYYLYRVKKGDATHGEWAMFFPVGGGRGQLPWSLKKRKRKSIAGSMGFQPGAYYPPYDWKGQPGSVAGLWHRDIFNTISLRRYQRKVESINSIQPSDWSAYDVLRMDVKSGADAVLRLAVEDEDILPAVERRFKIPAGGWVTVELDLKKAVEARDMDLSKIANLWVFLEETAAPTTLLLDNIRVSPSGAKSPFRVLRDESSYEAGYRTYVIDSAEGVGGRGRWKPLVYPEKDTPLPAARVAGMPEKRGPWHVDIPLPPSKRPRKTIPEALVCRAPWHYRVHPQAFDSKRIMAPLWDMGRSAVKAVATVDGGETWTGLDGKVEPTPIASAHRSMFISNRTRDESYSIGITSCSGYNYPGDRVFIRKIGATAEGWQVYPATPVGFDLRHCSAYHTATKASSGKIWAAWSYYGRLRTEGTAAKYSSDGGRTWHSPRPGKKATLPKSEELLNARGGYAGTAVVVLVPWKDEVACVISKVSYRPYETYAWFFEDDAWSEPKRIEWPKKAGKTGPVFSYAAIGEELMLLVSKCGVVGTFDGATFREENPPGYAENMKSIHPLPRIPNPQPGYAASGFLSVCGKKVLLFAAAAEKVDGAFAPKKILCWRRGEDGAWSKAAEVVSEEKAISSFICGLYSPEEFTPLTWTCAGERRLKIMLVPSSAE